MSAEIGADTAASTGNGRGVAEVDPCPSLRVARADTSCPSAEIGECCLLSVYCAHTVASSYNGLGVANVVFCPSLGVARADGCFVSICRSCSGCCLLFFCLDWCRYGC